MPADAAPRRLTSQRMVNQHLRQLIALDPRLQAIHDAVGKVPLRSRSPGFAGLARIVCGQQVSVASADAIWRRLEALPGATTPDGFLALGQPGLQGAGLSQSKFQSLTLVAQALRAGDLDLAAIEALPADAAIAALTRHKGIGPWTAEIYLMFCAGHPDIFPAGDIALQKAVGEALTPGQYPDRKQLIRIAAAWAPYRATAALLFWGFYRKARQRDGLGL
ncbi:DNA-3-methyladenine glycosylase family protein [Bordetella petrii]|uniref:DNA-3-methyladenine glycosylase family protein n=1 Tax=Bordetella petrii TaxID=94624 RepID=UPI001E579A62|nr:DNA-3-methyladenine glycosylase 2 family protein [Bordetella petrii]MCD0502876.1 DNA-3-methyladenine glycosylase 2 family protein [Bordetella petrii]